MCRLTCPFLVCLGLKQVFFWKGSYKNQSFFQTHQDEFNTQAALLELYKYVQAYNDDLVEALDEDEFARRNRLNLKLEQVQIAMNGEAYCWAWERRTSARSMKGNAFVNTEENVDCSQWNKAHYCYPDYTL